MDEACEDKSIEVWRVRDFPSSTESRRQEQKVQ